MVDRVIWCDRGWQPLYYGFCPSESAWKREMHRLGVDEPYPTTAGRCTLFENSKSANECVLVTIAAASTKRKKIEIVGLIVHEAMHVWRFIRERIGEREPSLEFEAYAMQAIAQNLIVAYEQTRGRLTRV